MERLRALAPYAHWLLRLALASVFLYHGIIKFPALAGIADMMGMPVFIVGILAAAEVAAALLILAGGFSKAWLTRIGGAIIAVVMLGAIFMVHLQHGWNSVNMGSGNMGQGMEFQFTLLMIGLYFVIVGNGAWADVAVDRTHRTSASHAA